MWLYLWTYVAAWAIGLLWGVLSVTALGGNQLLRWPYWAVVLASAWCWRSSLGASQEHQLAQDGLLAVTSREQWQKYLRPFLIVAVVTILAMLVGRIVTGQIAWILQSPLTHPSQRLAVELAAGAAGGVVVGYLAYRLAFDLIIARLVTKIFDRGRVLLTREEATQIANSQRHPEDPGLPLGGVQIPSNPNTPNFLFVGAPGSGKSLSQMILMRQTIGRFRHGSNSRAVVYDAKTNLVPVVYGIAPQCPVHLLHPLDRRSSGWNVALDCKTPSDAKQLCSDMIQEQNDSQRYFLEAARDISSNVMISWMKTVPNRWTFRDLLWTLRSPFYLEQVLTRTPETRHAMGYFKPHDTFMNTLTTLQTKLSRYEPVFAAWHRAEKQISLERDWIGKGSVLVLGNDASIRAMLETINRLIIQRCSELLLALQDTDKDFTWFFLDELREMGKLDGLGTFLTNGRSKGGRAALGYQDIEGLRSVYGKEVANEMLAMCTNKAIFRVESAETAQWASEVLGDRDMRIRERGTMNMNDPSTSNLNEQQRREPAMLPSEFLTMPYPNKKDGLTGVYLSANIGAWQSVQSGQEIADALPTPTSRASNFEPRPIEHQFLLPWTDADFQRLGLKREEEV